jgi:hypothetical protein
MLLKVVQSGRRWLLMADDDGIWQAQFETE